MNRNKVMKFLSLECFLAVAFAAAVSFFISFKVEHDILGKLERSFIAHAQSLIHMRSYAQLAEPGSENKHIEDLLAQIQALDSDLQNLVSTTLNIEALFPDIIWPKGQIQPLVAKYENTAQEHMGLLDELLKAKKQPLAQASIEPLQRAILTEDMDEAIEHIHEELMNEIFKANNAMVTSLLLATCVMFLVVVLYLYRYIDALREAQIALKEAVKTAQEATAAKSMFLATMSHELRTPMNGVIGMAQIIASEMQDESQKSNLNILLESSEHLMSVLNEILDFSKLEQNKLELVREPFPVIQLLSPVASSFYPLAAEKGIVLQLHTKNLPDGTILVGDKARIRQIVYNLIGNAVKFTPQGHIDISLEFKESDETLTITVTDTGIGIHPTRLDSIFNSFEQADATINQNFGGTGLGLSIVKHLCIAMGGDVSVSSEVGVGSTFQAIIKTPKGITDSANPNAQQLEKFNLSELSVLLVEDNRVNQLVGKHLCEKLGCHVSVAENGRMAIDMLQEEYYDAILMDNRMPEMNGIEATRFIRQSLNYQGLILACTADATTDTSSEFLAAGADRAISKPLRLEKLESVLTHYFQQHDTRKDYQSVSVEDRA
ncbi:ATP-binding protein [Photobacterium sp. CCB-ST2H9]|uniref:ATP-binding protein n=1 Tax=Photobacterium sp. CCB-ST2H9 TaxID=2912855 RepID=UPI0020060D25|nr:ATP-binding protein [Photobacterium sp. CCB-ST2H9]UTM55930.1 ATP-binding protein [Photobacterium sp. CCB-ST2H9]